MNDEPSLPKRSRRRPEGRERRLPPPLTEAALNDLALAYAARYATTRARLLRYLARKLKERGWDGAAPADAAALADRLVALRYVDDAAFAAMKARAMAARGLGRRRVEAGLAAAGVAEDDRGAAPDAAEALAIAVDFARRKRLGPFAREPAADQKARQKMFAAMLRAGHSPAVARQVLAALTVAEAEQMADSG